jgi:plastocyanin
MNRITLALGVALAALVVAAPVAAGPSASTATTVTVTMKEFKFALSRTKVPHGTVTFKFVNKGKLPHDFKIAGKKSKMIQPGKTGTLVVALKAGKLPYICTVPGHAAGGMKGTLSVTGLEGEVNGSFKIKVTKDGVAVKTIKAGTYQMLIDDKSSSHNFRLKGPGVNKATTVGFVGKQTWTVTLKPGRYTFQCDPHATQGMKGTFQVTA